MKVTFLFMFPVNDIINIFNLDKVWELEGNKSCYYLFT